MKKESEVIYKVGDRVTWSYWHQIGRSRFCRAKHGTVTYITKCATRARVKFDGNKTASTIPLSKLKILIP